MIELTFKDINNQLFHVGAAKLANCQSYPPKLAYQIGRILDKVGSHTQEARVLYKKIIEKYAAKNEKGEVVQTQAPPFFEFKEGANKQAFDDELGEFLEIKVTIEKNKIPLSALPDSVGLKPSELQAIEGLFDFEEDEDLAKVLPLREKN